MSGDTHCGFCLTAVLRSLVCLLFLAGCSYSHTYSPSQETKTSVCPSEDFRIGAVRSDCILEATAICSDGFRFSSIEKLGEGKTLFSFQCGDHY